jgi:hypothetical protein
MARVQFDVFIKEMRGVLGDLVYSTRNGTTYVRRRWKCSRPPTQAQAAHRARFAEASRRWRGLDAEERASWNARAKKLKRSSGFNLFVRESMRGGG